MDISFYEDGGTAKIVFEEYSFYIDYRKNSKNKGAIYNIYPNDKGAYRVTGLDILQEYREILEQARKEIKNNLTIIFGLQWINERIDIKLKNKPKPKLKSKPKISKKSRRIYIHE